jgi:Skp family chaperone for outer membrane proteins
MKIKLSLTIIFLLLAGASAFAQGAGAQPAGEVPKVKVAIVDWLAFREEVHELKAKYDKLKAEFAPKYRELEAMQNTLAAKQKVLQENTSMTPPQAQKLNAEIEQVKKDYNRALEDAEALADKREAEETQATYEKLEKFLDQYCSKHGITTVFEARRLQETGVVVYVAPGSNITADFIKEYNKANPQQAAAAPAK